MPVKCLPYCYKFSIFSHHIDNIQLCYELWFSFHDLRAMFVFICVIWTESERTNRSEIKKSKQKRLCRGRSMYLKTHTEKRNYYLSNQKRQKCRAIFGSSAENAFWYSFPVDVQLKPGRLENIFFPFLSFSYWQRLTIVLCIRIVCVDDSKCSTLFSPLFQPVLKSLDVCTHCTSLDCLSLSDVCISTL